MSIISRIKAKRAISKLKEEKLYEAAASETGSGKIRQGLWAKALIEVHGDHSAAKARYLKLLVQTMEAERDVSQVMSDNAPTSSHQQRPAEDSTIFPDLAQNPREKNLRRESTFGDILAVFIVIFVAVIAAVVTLSLD